MATRASTRVNRGVGPIRLRDELAATQAGNPAPYLPPHSPPLPQQGGAGPRLVAAGLQEDMFQLGGRHAAQLAGREAAWDLQQNAAVEVEQAEDEPDQEGIGQEMFDLRGRTQPQVPQAAGEGDDVIGWKAIDRLGGWDAFLV